MTESIAAGVKQWIGLTDHGNFSIDGQWVWLDNTSAVICVDNSGQYLCTPQNNAYNHWADYEPRHYGDGYFYGYMGVDQLWYSVNLGATQNSYVVEFDLPVDNTPVVPTKTFAANKATGGLITLGSNGHVYAAIAAPSLTWAEAAAAAKDWEYQGVQGHLVSISDVDEQSMTESIAAVKNQWIGLTDHPYHSTTGEWVWLDNTSAVICVDNSGSTKCTPQNNAYNNWASSEPRHYADGYHYGYMLAAYPSTYVWYSAKLGSRQNSYVVEFDLPIDNTTVLPTKTFSANKATGGLITLGSNGHVYAAIAAPSLTWAEAAAAAKDWEYQGVQGHLVSMSGIDEQSMTESIAAGVKQWIGLP